jgi:hypothetical protein
MRDDAMTIASDATAAQIATSTDKDMPGALRQACEDVKMLLRRNDARDANERYQIGCIIRDVRNDVHKYGEGSVGKIARAVGRDVDTLYQYADVAETWSQIELARLLERKTLHGVPLSFSHLIELSKVRRNRDLLRTLTNRAFDGLSVRHLRALVDQQRRAAAEEPVRPLVPTSRLLQMIKRCSSVIDSARSLDDYLRELSTVESTPALAQLLLKAIETQDELRQLCDANLHRLADAHARVSAELAAHEPADAAASETSRKCEANA